MNAQVHRLNELVALWLPNGGETCYISATEARAIARALGKAAKSIKTETFACNSCGTLEIPLESISISRFRGDA